MKLVCLKIGVGGFILQCFFSAGAWASTKSIDLPADARNIRILSLHPAQILKSSKQVKNPDCGESSQHTGNCLAITQPIYEDGVQLQIAYEGGSDVFALAQGSAQAQASVVEKEVRLERGDFSPEQLLKLETLSDRESAAYARQILKLSLTTSTVIKQEVNQERAQFCNYAPDPEKGPPSDPSCLKKGIYRNLAETRQLLSITPQK